MPETDLERNDELDGLTSEELEERAFGPDPDAPRSAALRGLVRRSERATPAARPPLAERPGGTGRRLLVAAGGLVVLALAAVGAGAILGLNVRGYDGEPYEDVVFYDDIEHDADWDEEIDGVEADLDEISELDFEEDIFGADEAELSDDVGDWEEAVVGDGF